MSTFNLKIEAWALQLDKQTFAPFPIDILPAQAGANPQRLLQRAHEKSALRRVLSLNLSTDPEDIFFTIAPEGKPSVDGCEFSISHSGPWLVIATGTAPLGVDVETRPPRLDPMELAERFFSTADKKILHAVEPEQRRQAFLRQWVAKEAALKALGTGLGGNLHRARCVFEGSPIRAVALDAEYFSIAEFSLSDGTPGALAWQGDSAAEIVWRNPEDAGLS
jgi:4'-phosphopantetheinyl transferase